VKITPKQRRINQWILYRSVISSEGLVCPYCSKVEKAETRPDIFYEDADDEGTCPYCKKKYEITQIINVSWETRPKAKYFEEEPKPKYEAITKTWEPSEWPNAQSQLIKEVERLKRQVEAQRNAANDIFIQMDELGMEPTIPTGKTGVEIKAGMVAQFQEATKDKIEE